MSAAAHALFEPLAEGALRLPNRIVMAPMTRLRADADGVPTRLTATYYAQRASAGLIVTEGTAVSATGRGDPRAPGIYTDAHVQGWQRVTDAVHAAGGRIVLQVVHYGREVPAEGLRAMTVQEIDATLDAFHRAAERAMAAGFDAIEVQAANGHLIDQFLQDHTNRRDDRYGGSIENRMTLLFEIVERVASSIGRDRVGVRLSPFGTYRDIRDSRPLQLFTAVIKNLSASRVAYLHLVEARASEIELHDVIKQNGLNNAKLFREHFDGPLITAGGYSPTSAAAAINAGYADAVAFGRMFTSNPDLVERIRENIALTPHQRGTFYGGEEHGYTDFPRAT